MNRRVRIVCVLCCVMLTVWTQNRSAWAVEEEKSAVQEIESKPLIELSRGITSFGAAVLEDALYIYGGHFGSAHSYSLDEQSNQLLRLDLKKPTGWKELAGGPRLQGLALLAHGGKLYRVGGFSARNKEGEDDDLWSQDSFARFDPKTNKWEDLPPLLTPRSSHDAVVVGDSLYVVGGWSMQGSAENDWQKAALAIDLSVSPLQWKQLPTPPFERRALSLAQLDGKVYAIGGISSEGDLTNEVAVYDPRAKRWSTAGELQGEEIEGFGASAFSTDNRLYVSTITGSLQCLNAAGDGWDVVGRVAPKRFFHRMVEVGKGKLLLVGGTNRQTGKVLGVDVIDVEGD